MRPRPTCKAERVIRTLLGGWAYGAIYRSSAEGLVGLRACSRTTTIIDHGASSVTRRPSPASPSRNNVIGTDI